MLQRICPHCGKNVIESYGILNPYLYGSKLQKCNNCGGEFFDNRWREVAIQGFDPIQLTQEPQACQRFGLGGVAACLMESRQRLRDPKYVELLLSHSIKVPEEFMQGSR